MQEPVAQIGRAAGGVGAARARRAPAGGVPLGQLDALGGARRRAGGGGAAEPRDRGEALRVSAATVKTHLIQVYGKLDVRTRADLAAAATSRGLARTKPDP
jgi:hypothetical protein